mgnify:CR=1 FL=1
MYKLYFSNKDFTPNGIPKEKVPLLVKEDMSFEEIPTLWFFYLALESGRTRSPETWRGYAEAILDFFNTCHANNWNWKEINKNNLIAYRNNMIDNNNCFGRKYSKSTINNYITRVCLFYEWCVNKKYLNKLPFDKNLINTPFNLKDKFLMGHLKNNIYTNDLIIKEYKKIPHCLSRDEFNSVIKNLEERDTLIVKWSVLTGMRRKEVLGLKLKNIPQSSQSNSPILKITIDITKGDKPRDVYVPQSLIDETNKYIKFTRRSIALKYNTLKTEDSLWIAERTGKAIGKKTIEAKFRIAIKKSGINCTFHHLRHTYAIKMLSTLTKQTQNNGLNPLKTLQMLLGHSNINTTMIYLESLSIDLNEIEDSLTKFYGDII